MTGDQMAGRVAPAERPWWWPSSWDMGRAWQIWLMLMVSWGVLCWLHGPEVMARLAWQACPWCEPEPRTGPGVGPAAAWCGAGLGGFDRPKLSVADWVGLDGTRAA